jgi:hypothetical protein
MPNPHAHWAGGACLKTMQIVSAGVLEKINAVCMSVHKIGTKGEIA